MKIKSNRKMGKVKAFVFALCNLSIKNLTWLFIGIAVAEQLISASIEYLLFGEIFAHWFDSVFLITLANLYFYFSFELGKFLLDLVINSEVTDEN